MTGVLLDSKLSVPRRGGGVARPRLSQRLDKLAESRLTLVSAPAGFGKTTLLARWLTDPANAGMPVAWLSLDERDNDPVLFWSYMVTGVSRAADGAGSATLSVLQSAQKAMEPVLATLLNDLNRIAGDLIVVLDDFHVIESRDIRDGVAFLIEHLPPHIHFVIASRTDPLLPLPRFRARGELVEIRAKDLRFTSTEVEAYLNESMGLSLSANDVAALESRTEGWIAALQLAALSIQDRQDPSAFIAGFAGDDRFIVDFLVEEVLQRQSEDLQRFLLQTSILERLSGALVDAVTGQHNGKTTLVELERANLFLAPLDGSRQWFRYHQLFADVLQARLMDEHAAELADLHLRASLWFEENDEPHEAIRHALAGKHIGRAADLIELAVPALRRNRQEYILQRWLTEIPKDVVRVRPVLALEFVGAALLGGDTGEIDERLEDIGPWLDPDANASVQLEELPADVVIHDRDEFRRLPANAEAYRAALALSRGDDQGTVEHARKALALAPKDDHMGRAAAHGLLGLVYWGAGDLRAAHQAYSSCAAGLREAGFIADTFGCAIALADIRLAQGRLNDALATYEEALELAAANDGPTLRGTADMFVGMGAVHCERNDLQAASRLLERSEELGGPGGLPQNLYRFRVAMARVLEAEGDLDRASGFLQEAERLYVSDYFPNVRPVPALKARLSLKLGRLPDAQRWAEKHVSLDDILSYVREFEHVTLARVLLADYCKGHHANTLQIAIQLLGRLLQAARAGERNGSVIEILILQALALRLGGDADAAAVSLTEAVLLAEPQGYVRIFADEGAPMAALLKAAAKRPGTSTYLRRLLSATGSGANPPTSTIALMEPLSDRELEVLRLLGSDLSGPAIARALTVSLNTVRTHTARIYTKLGVNGRRAAVHQAKELRLLP